MTAITKRLKIWTNDLTIIGHIVEGFDGRLIKWGTEENGRDAQLSFHKNSDWKAYSTGLLFYFFIFILLSPRNCQGKEFCSWQTKVKYEMLELLLTSIAALPDEPFQKKRDAQAQR